MQKEIKTIDAQKQIIRVTTLDERWYARPEKDRDTGLPSFKFYPSATWIAGYYPKGTPFYKWLAQHGWNESEAIKESAGRRGDRVHKGSEILEETGELPISTVFEDPDTGETTSLTTEDLDCLLSFKGFHDEFRPELLANEMTVFGEDWAGTLDRIYRIPEILGYKNRIWITDLKTSKYIWPEHEIQVSSYAKVNIDFAKLGITQEEWDDRGRAILQLGYPFNKKGFKFTKVDDKYDLFRHARAIWANENPDAKPKEKDYPLTIKLSAKQESKEKINA